MRNQFLALCNRLIDEGCEMHCIRPPKSGRFEQNYLKLQYCAMESKLNFISCGYNGNGVSVLVSLEKRIRNEVKVVNRIVFNCGDGCQRICSERRLKLHTVNTIIITSLTPHNISGFPGLFLALSDLVCLSATVHQNAL